MVKIMKIYETEIKGAKIIEYTVNHDTRGYTLKPFSLNQIKEAGLKFEVKEIFYSTSNKDVIRGMHFQLPPRAQAKIVHLIKGKIMDVLLDLRTDSLTYGKYISIELEEGDGKIVYITKGLAHGFASLVDGSTVVYLFDSPYSSGFENGVRYDSFGYEWKIDRPILSPRDLLFPEFCKFRSPFRLPKGKTYSPLSF
jgi:dTDP-4-dehydrorhamnose 3,5-epimerase/CDP-3, 6-dideoxy-D-glycero-D-glycero-4-hexulose-5-epimerase